MTTTDRPIHRGISDFALWVLASTQGTAILAGRNVKVLEAKPSMVQREGWFNVKVQDVATSEEYWMDVTTSEHEQYSRDMALRRMRHRAERRKRGI